MSNPKKQAWQLNDRVLSSVRDLYDAEIASNDASFGELLNYLRLNNSYEDTLIVFVSDHGEEFYEHGRLGYGSQLFDEVVKVPLLIKVPGERTPDPIVPVAREFYSDRRRKGESCGGKAWSSPIIFAGRCVRA